jgi:hypothetical protein
MGGRLRCYARARVVGAQLPQPRGRMLPILLQRAQLLVGVGTDGRHPRLEAD